jgi:hypothetical protein
MGTAGGCKTTVNNALTFYCAFLATPKFQFETNTTKTPSSPFHQVPTLVGNQIMASSTHKQQQHYGLGWVLTELPSTLGTGWFKSTRVGS